MMRYATSCDAAYLPRLKVLFASMERHCRPFVLHVLAHGPEVEEWCFSQHPAEVGWVTTEELLEEHPELELERLPGPRRDRSDENLLRRGGPVTAIDVDMMFWSDPAPIFEEIGGAAMAVNPHAIPRFAEGIPGVSVETHGSFGLYNGGFVYFAELAPARAMADYVIEWCYPRLRTHADGRTTYGDQGYLELVLERFGGHVLEHPGVQAAPWNLNRRPPLEAHDGAVYVGGRPLILFHYQGFTAERRSHVEYCTTEEHDRILYVPYRRALEELT